MSVFDDVAGCTDVVVVVVAAVVAAGSTDDVVVVAAAAVKPTELKGLINKLKKLSKGLRSGFLELLSSFHFSRDPESKLDGKQSEAVKRRRERKCVCV